MCGYLCIRFIDFMLKGKSLLDYTNLFSPNKYEMNHKIILKYFLSFYPILEFLQSLRLKKSVAFFVVSIENLQTLKLHLFSKKYYPILLYAVSVSK